VAMNSVGFGHCSALARGIARDLVFAAVCTDIPHRSARVVSRQVGVYSDVRRAANQCPQLLTFEGRENGR
jgi:hypothetical protein